MKGILVRWCQLSKGVDGRAFDFSSGQWWERNLQDIKDQGERRSFEECYRMIDEIHPNHKPTHIMLWMPGNGLHGAIGEVESGSLKMVFEILSKEVA